MKHVLLLSCVFVLIGCGAEIIRLPEAIRNGDEITNAERPYVGSLLTPDLLVCTATLLSADTILTAAHCFDGSPTPGSVLFSRNAEIQVGSGIALNWYQLHPDYDPNGPIPGIGDIAIARLTTPITEVHHFPRLNQSNNFLLPQITNPSSFDRPEIVGYGADENDLVGIKRNGVTDFLGFYIGNELVSGIIQTPILALLAPPVEQQVACGGDSGGPAFILGDLIIGVAHAVPNVPCSEVTYAFYTSVANYRSWILTIADSPSSVFGDFNSNGSVDPSDIDLVRTALRNAQVQPRFDLNFDGVFDQSDVDFHVRSLAQTQYGDANFDKLVDAIDWAIIREGRNQPGGWSSGDANGDGIVTEADRAIWRQNFGWRAQ